MIQADVKLDTLGYFCPMPIIMTLKKFKELTLGQVLEVVSDDEGIKKDMPAWCDTTGHQMVGLEEEQTKSGTNYTAFVKKTKEPHSQRVSGEREAGGMMIRHPASLI
jgi:tRNA 2-thiouridine synthesizing protein A